MENLVVAGFKNLQNANEALAKLKQLDELDAIVIYNIVMIRRKEEDQFEILHHDGPDTRDLPAQGAIAGSLIGLIGGPIGMAIGSMVGVIAGASDEDDANDFFSEFLDEANKQLQPGNYAIVMDVEEDTASPIDSYMETYQGLVVRSELADQYYKYDQHQWEKLNKEIDDEEKALQAARQEDKAAIRAKISELKDEREERIKKLKIRIDNSKKHVRDKIKSLDKKIITSEGVIKERLKAHKEKLSEKLEEWNEEFEWAFA